MVTVPRVPAVGCVADMMLIVLVAPWGFDLDWQRISYASLTMVALWVFMSLRARRGYLHAFRQSIERQDLIPADVTLSGADLSTIETLVRELSNPEASRVVYAIDVLESLDKRNLVTPLLLYHESTAVKERALRWAGDPEGSRSCFETAEALRRTLGDLRGVAGAVPVVPLAVVDEPPCRVRWAGVVELVRGGLERHHGRRVQQHIELLWLPVDVERSASSVG